MKGIGQKPEESKKAPSRFAMLQEVEVSEPREGDPKLYRLVVDGQVGPKAVREAGASMNVNGNVLVVCIHEDLIATPKTEVTYIARGV